MKKTVKDVDLKNKKVLLRVDFNVPLDENGEVVDETKIVEALATIRYILSQNAKLIVCSHLGRPNGVDPKFSLVSVAKKLVDLLGCPVMFASDVVGKDAMKKAAALKFGQVLLLENVRFEEGEEKNDLDLAKKLASMADFFVNDAFGTSHRKHASTYGVASFLPNALGFLMGKETNVILKTMKSPERPFTLVVGGSKVNDKIEIIKNLIRKVDFVLIGGGMAFTFLKAMGISVGKSIVQDDKILLAKEILKNAKELGTKIVLPIDCVCAAEIDEDVKVKRFDVENIPDNLMGLDIGRKTSKLFTKIVKASKTAIWNGPMGVFEIKKFALGTKKIAKAFAKVRGTTIVGGGESAAAIRQFGLQDKITHISTGGGASLVLFQGGSLPCVEIISDLED
ncbi:MAG: phosphoglycerate kinase [Clostridia bacterium]